MTKGKTIIIIFLALFCANAIAAKVDSNKVVYSNLMVYNFNNQDFGKAIEYADKLIIEDPANPLAWTTKARALYQLEMKESSMEILDSTVSQFPDYTPAILFRAGMKYADQEWQLDEVISEFNRFLILYPNTIEVREAKADFLTKNGQYANALSEYNALLTLRPDDPKARMQRARVYYLLGQTDDALADLQTVLDGEKASELDIKLAALNDRSAIYIQNEMYPQAINDLTALLNMLPDSMVYQNTKVNTLNQRGYSYLMFGENLLALKDFDDAIRISPENTTSLKNRALTYLELNEKNKACEDITEALRLGYQDADGLDFAEFLRDNCTDEQ